MQRILRTDSNPGDGFSFPFQGKFPGTGHIVSLDPPPRSEAPCPAAAEALLLPGTLFLHSSSGETFSEFFHLILFQV